MPAIRLAARSLLRTPGFAAVAVLTLALGIGAAAAIFTVLNAVVLSPLPYAEPERLVRIENLVPGIGPGERWGLSPAGYFHFQDNSRSLESIAVYTTPRVSITGGAAAAERVQAARVSANMFGVLQARPALGRLLTPEDNRPSAEATSVLPGPAVPVAVLSHSLWSRRYGAEPAMIGRTIEVNGFRVPVVGVLEAGTDLPDPGLNVELWLPLGLNPNAQATNWHTFNGIARLEDGVDAARAERELAAFTRRFTELYPSAYSPSFMESTGFAPVVTPLRDHVIGSVSGTLWVLLAAVGLVLLIACANVANIFLVRTEGRRREIEIRAALGARRADLVRRFLTEGLLLAFLGGALGLLLAYWGVSGLLSLAPDGLPRLDEVGVGWTIIAFIVLLSALVGLAVGSFPLLRFRTGFSSGALREEERSATSGRQRNAARSVLVVAQVAMALVLLASAGLLLRSFQQLRSVEPGFDPGGALTMELTLPFARYDSYEAVSAFHQRLATRVEALPGVRAAGVVDDMPLANSRGCAALFLEIPATSEAAAPGCVQTTMASPGYFDALGIPVQGETPTWSDVNRTSGGIVVSRSLAERLWPGESAIGRGIRGNGREPPYYRVVGVAGDVRAQGLDQPVAEAVYFPLIPIEGAGLWGPLSSATLVVRSETESPEALAPAIRRIVADIDAEVPIANVRTAERIVAASMARTSFAMVLLGIAAAVALILGAVGLYGVISYVVGQRTKEIGIRVALGARSGEVATMVLRQALALVLTGLALGLVAALAATRVLESMLFEVSPTDPATLALVSLLLVAVALVASWRPARRATRVDPMVALRAE